MDDSTPRPRGSNIKTRDDDARGAPPGHHGNPPHVPTEAQRARVRQLASIFPPATQRNVALLMGFSYSCLLEHYRDDLDRGRAELVAAVGAQVIAAALDGNAPGAKGDRDLQKYVMSRLGGWAALMQLSGPDGGPIQVGTVDLSKFNPEQLAYYGQLSAIHEGVDPDTITAVPGIGYKPADPDPA